MMNNMKAVKGSDKEKERLSAGRLHKTKGHKPSRKWKRWQKILFYCVIAVAAIAVIGTCVYAYLRHRGENSLKAETRHIIYQGKEYKYRDGIINILCLGIDKWVPLDQIEERRGNIGMSDTILLVSLDTKNDEVKVIAVPRDTMVEVQTTTEDGGLGPKEKMQICYQYAFGKSVKQSNELTMETVSQLLYDTPIQRYCTLNIEALPILNDAIGGVDVEIREDVEQWEPRLIYGETMHLEGELALRFVKVRNKNRPDGATLRTQRQKQYAVEFVKKAKSVIAKDPTIPVTIFQELQKDGNMSTDITLEDIAYLMPEVMGVSFPDDAIQVIPGESKLGEDGFAEYHRDVDALKELVIDSFYEEV